MKDSNLLFVVSQPRSGSTLTQAILSNNSFVQTVSEPWIILPQLSLLKPDLISAKYDYKLAVHGINDFSEKVGGKEVLIDSIRTFALNLYEKMANVDTKYVLDKTPRYYEVLDEIVRVFPNAKIICLKRHPLAVLNSIMETWCLGESKNSLHVYYRDLLYAPFLINKFVINNRRNNNVLSVTYEDIVSNPELEVQRIYKWLDLPFSGKEINYSTNTSFKGLLGDPVGVHKYDIPVKNSLDTWKKNLNREPFKDLLLGYGSFLGQAFLKDYGDYEYIGENSPAFDEYLFLYKNDFVPASTSIKLLLKYKMFRLTGISRFLR